MKLLLIDTCGTTGSVALADTTQAQPIYATAALPGRTASERLVGTIRELAASNNTILHSLDAIAVVSGPGSFTGVRVGLSAAKGLGEALGLPLIAISRLAALANTAALPAPTPRFAVLDAGRGELYLRVENQRESPTESLVTREQLLATMDRTAYSATPNGNPPLLITCEPAIVECFAGLHPLLVREPTAEDALPLVIRRLDARDYDDIAIIDANYLRRTDAEIFAKPVTAAADHVRSLIP